MYLVRILRSSDEKTDSGSRDSVVLAAVMTTSARRRSSEPAHHRRLRALPVFLPTALRIIREVARALHRRAPMPPAVIVLRRSPPDFPSPRSVLERRLQTLRLSCGMNTGAAALSQIQNLFDTASLPIERET